MIRPHADPFKFHTLVQGTTGTTGTTSIHKSAQEVALASLYKVSLDGAPADFNEYRTRPVGRNGHAVIVAAKSEEGMDSFVGAYDAYYTSLGLPNAARVHPAQQGMHASSSFDAV